MAATVVAVSAVSAVTASAQFSQLNLVGSTKIYQNAPGPTNNLIIDFQPLAGGVGVVRTCCDVGDQTGVFSILPDFGFVGSNIDFVFGPNSSPSPTTPPVNFLNIGGFSFTALAFGTGNTGTPVFLTYDPTTNTTTASLNVTGTVTGPGVGGVGTFFGSYTTQFPNLNPVALVTQIENGTTLTKSVSATFTVSSVPEPATFALMGTGLVALVGFARRRRQDA